MARYNVMRRDCLQNGSVPNTPPIPPPDAPTSRERVTFRMLSQAQTKLSADIEEEEDVRSRKRGGRGGGGEEEEDVKN